MPQRFLQNAAPLEKVSELGLGTSDKRIHPCPPFSPASPMVSKKQASPWRTTASLSPLGSQTMDCTSPPILEHRDRGREAEQNVYKVNGQRRTFELCCNRKRKSWGGGVQNKMERMTFLTVKMSTAGSQIALKLCLLGVFINGTLTGGKLPFKKNLSSFYKHILSSNYYYCIKFICSPSWGLRNFWAIQSGSRVSNCWKPYAEKSLTPIQAHFSTLPATNTISAPEQSQQCWEARNCSAKFPTDVVFPFSHLSSP